MECKDERIFKNTCSGKCEDQKENSSFHEGGNRRRARSMTAAKNYLNWLITL